MRTPNSAGGVGVYTTEVNADLRAASETVACQCFDLQPGESLVVVTDDKCERIGEAFYEVTGEVTDDATIVHHPPGNQHGEELSALIAAAIQTCDTFLAPATKSLSHTRARGDACDAGVRDATLPGITEEAFVTGLDADYDAIYDHSTAMLDVVGGADELRVTTEKGTDVTFVHGDREWLADIGVITEAGSFSNLPAGEIFFSSVSATGTYVVDGTMMPRGLLDKGRELRFEVEDGYVTEISDDDIREQIEAVAEEVGDDAYNLAEIGAGTNVGVTDLVGSILLDEKAAGTVYTTVGDDAGISDDTGVPLHLDGIIREPAAYADGEEVDLSQP